MAPHTPEKSWQERDIRFHTTVSLLILSKISRRIYSAMGEEGRRWEDLGIDCLVIVLGRLSLEDLSLGAALVCKSWHKASLRPQCWNKLNFREMDFMPWNKFTRRFMHEYRPQRFSFNGFMKFAINRSQRSAVELLFPPGFIATLEDMIYAANECPKLKILVLPKLSSEDEKHLPGLIGKWKDLEWLDMGSKPCSFIQVLTQLNIHCPNFSGLKMAGSICTEDALAIVSLVPMIRRLCLSNSYLRKEALSVILNGCKYLEILEVLKCVGFEADGEVRTRASNVKIFKWEGSRLSYNDHCNDDDCDDVLVI